ncbi:MAG: MFS transporter [Clostridiaceae bacterium]|nr:MFS transporter [Clostridiaceae bacterium]
MKKVKNGKITGLSKLGYGMGEVTFGCANTILSVYLLITLTDYLKINPVWASVIVVIGIIWDAFSDPIIGWLSDNSGGKFGRRRRYLLFYAIPLGIMFFLLWMFPTVLLGGSEAVKIIVVLGVYLCVITLLTLVNVPYGSIILEMTDDYDERTSLTSFRMVCSAFATLGSIFIADTLLGEQPVAQAGDKLIYVGIVFGIVLTVTSLLCFGGTFERRKFIKPAKRPPFNFKKYVLESWKSKPFRQVTIAYLCAFTVIGLLQTLLQYYATYWLRTPNLFVIMAGMVLLVAILSTPLWVGISKKFGKKNTFLASCLLAVVSLIGIFFIQPLYGGDAVLSMEESLAYMPTFGYVFITLLGVGVGGVQLMPFSMMPDAINFSMKDGDMDEGAYYGIVTFVQKVGMGAATMLIGPVLSLANYTAPYDGWEANKLFIQPHQSANDAIHWMFVALSIVVVIIGALAVLTYKIDKNALQNRIGGQRETLDVEIPNVEDLPPEAVV